MLNNISLEIFWPLQKFDHQVWNPLPLASAHAQTHRMEVINGDLTGCLFNKGNKPKHKEGWLKKRIFKQTPRTAADPSLL